MTTAQTAVIDVLAAAQTPMRPVDILEALGRPVTASTKAALSRTLRDLHTMGRVNRYTYSIGRGTGRGTQWGTYALVRC